MATDRTSAFATTGAEGVTGDCAELAAFWQAEALFSLPVGLGRCAVCDSRFSLLSGLLCEPCQVSLDAMDDRAAGGEALQYVMGVNHETVRSLVAQHRVL